MLWIKLSKGKVIEYCPQRIGRRFEKSLVFCLNGIIAFHCSVSALCSSFALIIFLLALIPADVLSGCYKESN